MSLTTPLSNVVAAGAVATDREREAWAWLGGVPQAVVRPESTEEVAALISWASARSVGVVPVGSGRHAGPGRVDAPFVVLSTERLTGMEVYEPADLTFTARAGTTLADLDAALRAHGQWVPADPPRAPERTLGGLVAAGASGPLWAGYGEVRNHVLGMTVVGGDGRVLRLGGGVVKNVAGFDLLKPIVGSRGTLAVVTSVCMRTFPVPACDVVLLLRGERPDALVAAARAVCTSPLLPVSSVLVAPARTLRAGAALVVRLHGAAETVRADRAALERHAGVLFERFEERRADEVLAAVRDHLCDEPVVLRISVLPARLAETIDALRHLNDARLAIDTYAGRFRVGLRASGAEVVSVARPLREAVEALGGALGVERLPADVDPDDVASARSDDERALTAGLERVFDPEGVLWRRQR